MNGRLTRDGRNCHTGLWWLTLAVGAAVLLSGRPALAETAAGPAADPSTLNQIRQFLGPQGLSTSLEILLLLTVLSLAPSIVIMMTSFTRIVIVLALLRQALAIQQLPPTQVLVGLALFMTILIMAPVAVDVHQQAVQPYVSGQLGPTEALDRAAGPIRQFMSKQIENTGNGKDVRLFTDYLGIPAAAVATYDDVPLQALIPAFMVSEMKTAFLIGFKLYLPFLIIDMVVSSVLISMGMLMLPPVLVSLPFKLLLFVLVDGWHLVAATLLGSFAR